LAVPSSRLTKGHMDITIEKPALLEILVKNKGEHAEIYKVARATYLEKVRAALAELVVRFNQTEKLDMTPVGRLVEPQSFESSYDEAIEMLKHDISETIRLDPKDFRQFVQDKWSWQNTFYASNSRYVDEATTTAMSKKLG
jgi:hypothetical protein